MRLLAIAATGLFVAAVPAAAQQSEAGPPQALARVLDCRSLTGAAERLACFDREVAAMEAAHQAQQLLVMDAQQIRETRRRLFGLSLPNLPHFGDREGGSEAVSQVETTIRSARQGPNGRWILVLEDGGRWVQTDSRNLAIEPQAGQPIRIRRAALGSYLANIASQTAIRVRREQ